MVAPSQRRETLKGLAVAAAIVVAMVGLFFYERSQFGEYDVAFAVAQRYTQDEGGTLNEGQSMDFSFHVPDEDVARVRFTVTWTDDVGDPDTFRVAAAGPGDALDGSAEGPQSPLQLVVPVAAMPNATSVPARDAAEAFERASADSANETGTGNWTARVTLVSAPGAAGPGGLQAGATGDGSNAFQITFAYDVYEAVAPGDS